MSITVRCTCGRRFETREADAGDLVRCPDCGRELTVPRPVSSAAGVSVPAKPGPSVKGGREPDVPEPSAPGVLVPGKPERSGISGKAIVSLALGVLLVFGCLSGVPAILLGRRALKDIRLSGGRIKGEKAAISGIILGLLGCLFSVVFFLPAVRSSREAARRAQCINNLRQIGLAMQNYHEVYGCLPPAAITGKNGRPLLSWRVAILPFVEANMRYSNFRLDEPWDSPHNLSLLDAMPSFYVCPSDPKPRPGMTGYQVVLGASTVFTPDFTPVRLADVTGGSGYTLLVGETRRVVPWTKPEDLSFDSTAPLHGLGSHHGYHNNGFNALFVDGSVRFLKGSITARALAALLTRGVDEDSSPTAY